MPRRPRINIEGGIYHVHNRFARGAEIFSEGDEASRFLELLKKVRDRDGLTVFAWCLMSNHFHVALRAGPIPMARSLGFVQARFGQDYNFRHHSSGPRWQSRYKAHLVGDQGHLQQLVSYIHLNPFVAKIVNDPADYPFSGHRELLGDAADPLIDVEGVLAMFGETEDSARWAYVRGLREVGDAHWKAELPGRLPWWGIERDRPVQPEQPDAWLDELGRSSGLERRRMEPREYLGEVCNLLEIDPVDLTGEGKSRALSRTRYLIAALGAERWGQPAKKLGELVGRRGDAVSRWVKRGSELRMTDERFREAYFALDRALASGSSSESAN